MVNKPQYINYLVGSVCKAKQQGVLSEYLYYLLLKQCNYEGVLLHGQVINTFSSVCSISPSTVSSIIKRLIKLGFLIPYYHKNGKLWKYSLLSYDSVWKKLDLQKTTYNIIRIKSFSLKTIKELKTYVQLCEIYDNQQRQAYREGQKLECRIYYYKERIKQLKKINTYDCKKNTIENKQLQELHNEKLLKYTDKLIVLKDQKDRYHNCIQSPLISCNTISKKLKYRSPMSASLLQKIGERVGLITVIRKTVQICKLSFKEFKQEYLTNQYFWNKGYVYERFCNIIHFTSTFFKFQYKKDDVSVNTITP